MNVLPGFLDLFSIPLTILLIPALVGGALWLGRRQAGQAIILLAVFALIFMIITGALVWSEAVNTTYPAPSADAELAMTTYLSVAGPLIDVSTLFALGLSFYFSILRRSLGWSVGMLAALSYFVALQQSATLQVVFLPYLLNVPINGIEGVYAILSGSVLAVVALIYGVRLSYVTRNRSMDTEDMAVQTAEQIIDRVLPGEE